MPVAFSDAELLKRYRATYGLAGEVPLSIAQVRRHLELETSLTTELLASPRQSRWDTFERCYGQLYTELPWLNGTGGNPDVGLWSALIGRPPASVYEVGSGTGALALALARAGYQVNATDIARVRGDRQEVPNVRWSTTDGVHLDQFAPECAFDAVISDQVLEHLHPEDIVEHLRSARALLKPGGRYVFRTPHALTGPHDLSKVFGYERPIGMHLHEYTNTEMAEIVKAAGYSRLMSVLYSPRIYRRPIATRAHLRALIGIEWILPRLGAKRERAMVRFLRGPARLDVFLVAVR